MTPETAQGWLDVATAAAAVATIIFGWIKWIRPRLHKAAAETQAVRDAILGREEHRDSITGVVDVPALPGVGKRLARMESEQVTQRGDLGELTHAVRLLAENAVHTDEIERTLAAHGGRIDNLEQQSIERIVGRQETAQAYRLMADLAEGNPRPDMVDKDGDH